MMEKSSAKFQSSEKGLANRIIYLKAHKFFIGGSSSIRYCLGKDEIGYSMPIRIVRYWCSGTDERFT